MVWSSSGPRLEFLVELQRKETIVSFSEFISWVDAGQVDAVTITGNGSPATKGKEFAGASRRSMGLANRLIEKRVIVNAKAGGLAVGGAAAVVGADPLVIGFWIFFMRVERRQQALSFGKTRRSCPRRQKKVTFRDVAGADEI